MAPDTALKMDANTALSDFYKRNNIEPSRSCDEDSNDYDEIIAELPRKIDEWLNKIDQKDHSLFLELLSKYHYLTGAVCRKRYREIVDMLQQSLPAGVAVEDVLIITTESGNGRLSGGDSVRADIRLDRKRIKKNQVIASQSKAFASKDESREIFRRIMSRYKAVLFLDDIIGSGLTLKATIREFCKRYQDCFPDMPLPLLFYACIAPRKKGIKNFTRDLRSKAVHVTPLLKDEWYEFPAFDKNSPQYKQIESYEEKIAGYPSPQDQTFFMGFNTNKLLISFYYNTPNNTLCSFWRITPDNVPPFPRDGNQPEIVRPSLKDLQAKSAENRDNAYEFGKDRLIKEKLEEYPI